MIYRIKAPNKVETTITLPTSKSISNRALILNALSYSAFQIRNLSDSDDTKMLAQVLNSNTTHFDVGPAGTTFRFLTAYLSKIVGEWTLTGSERMKQRPVKILVDALLKLGAKIEYLEKEGYPPLKIFGSSLQGGEIELDGSVSSQYISAILMIAPTLKDGLTLKLTGDIGSRPYIEMTLALMAEFGIKSSWKGNSIHIEEQNYSSKNYEVEGDWSAASYWHEIAALASDSSITIKGLHKNSLQGDSKVIEIAEKLGIHTQITKKGAKLSKESTPLKKLIYNFSDQPDLAQTFVVTCAMLNIPFRFSGLRSLKIKETDRMTALMTELKKFGYLIQETDPETLEWEHQKCEPETTPIINTYKDHRMAMAFAPIALIRGEVCIQDPQVVTKSYPNFWEDLKKAGFTIIEE